MSPRGVVRNLLSATRDWLSLSRRCETEMAADDTTASDTENRTVASFAFRARVFAVGDVRSGSVKRVGGAIGEGAQVVAALHGFLADAAKPAA